MAAPSAGFASCPLTEKWNAAGSTIAIVANTSREEFIWAMSIDLFSMNGGIITRENIPKFTDWWSYRVPPAVKDMPRINTGGEDHVSISPAF